MRSPHEYAVPYARVSTTIGDSDMALIREVVRSGATLSRGSIRLYSRTQARAKALRDWARSEGITVAGSGRDAIRDADVICTVTSKCQPALVDSDVRSAGVDVNAMGAFGPECRELPAELVSGARIFFDNPQAALRDMGDLLVPLQASAVTGAAIIAELCEVLGGAAERQGSELTILKSLGSTIEDVVACPAIYERAVHVTPDARSSSTDPGRPGTGTDEK